MSLTNTLFGWINDLAVWLNVGIARKSVTGTITISGDGATTQRIDQRGVAFASVLIPEDSNITELHFYGATSPTMTGFYEARDSDGGITLTVAPGGMYEVPGVAMATEYLDIFADANGDVIYCGKT